MISRLTACAALFAVLATATLTFAAETQQERAAAARSDAAAIAPMQIIQLPTVTIVGHRAR
jgi:hypothetical protein